MKILKILTDIYFVGIKGFHKHNYVRVSDGVTEGMRWQRHQCADDDCRKTVGLDEWQIRDLPASMRYERYKR